jgi:hypothetical protein
MAEVEPDIATVIADVAVIEANVATVMADFHPVITNAPAIMVESTLGLRSSGSKDQTGCEHYSKFRFHNIHFYWFIESILNSYIGRRGGGVV